MCLLRTARVLPLFLLALAAVPLPARAEELSLDDRALLKQVEDEALPHQRDRINIACGIQAMLSIDTASVTSHDAILDLDGQGMDALASALEHVCASDIGKQAVAAKIKTLVLVNKAHTAERGLHLKDGVLELDGAWGMGRDGYLEDSEIEAELNKLL